MAKELAANPAEVKLPKFARWATPVSTVFLTGFMGAGKSTVGRELASLLQWRFTDLDDLIEKKAGASIPKIFATSGEPAFRRLEHETLKLMVDTPAPASVIALGGGTIAQPSNIPLLVSAESPVIFLDAPIEELRARCSRIDNRPLFRTEAEFRSLYESRLPYYRQAHVQIATAGKSSLQIAREIVSLVDLEVTP